MPSKPSIPRHTEKTPPTPPDTDDNDSSPTTSYCNSSASSPSSSSSSSASYSSSGETDDHELPLPPPPPPTQVLDEDKKTPDRHVPRDSRMIRLTGLHPYNVEAPLSDLFREGFLTSQELFYVRNHGPVPQVHDADIPAWELSVEG
ncbi:MAG: hypothetical protein M1831_004458 [Alyxoria varia]|nr:MAG: hypothetical protein M1831_004458 [Alyxoria varia]